MDSSGTPERRRLSADFTVGGRPERLFSRFLRRGPRRAIGRRLFGTVPVKSALAELKPAIQVAQGVDRSIATRSPAELGLKPATRLAKLRSRPGPSPFPPGVPWEYPSRAWPRP